MRTVVIGAAMVFVAWCAGLALAGEPKLDAELAQARYVVQPPATAAAVPTPPVGDEAPDPSIPLAIPPSTGPAVAVRKLNAQQLEPTVPPPATLTIPHYDQWVRLAECESGGDWQINTGNGYYGGLQFSLTSWKGAGGQRFAAYPHMATAGQQMLTAERLYEMQGWGAWPSCSRKVGLR